MDRCMFEPANGREPDCNGACKTKEYECPYFLIDRVWHTIKEWAEDARVETPILWKRDHKRNKLCLYTTRPGLFIGLHGERYQRFWEKLKEADPNDEFIKNGIDIIECDDGIGE